MPGSPSELTTQSQFIRAGAGAGKTTKLIGTFLQFVKEFKAAHQRFPRVVLTTFTRKATQEVKERLLVSALKNNEKEIFEYINQRSFVHISTIHGLLSLFLKQYSDLLQFPQEIKVVDGPEYQRKLKRQINELLKNKSEYLELLESYSFVKLVDISEKALELKAQNRNFTFVGKNDLEKFSLQQRQMIQDTIDKILAGSSVAGKSWAAYLDYLSRIKAAVSKNNFSQLLEVLDEAPRKPAFKESAPSIDPGVHELVLELTGTLLKDLYDSDEFIQTHEGLNSLFNEYINELYEISFRQKRLTGELTLADLESLTLQIIENHPQAAQEFSDSWDYFMIDEYQDTSPLQVKILNSFVRKKPCFVVGDPQQSIYLFRGARSEVFDLKQKEMEEKKARIDFLETNYRSDNSLMNFINLFFSEFSSQFKAMIPKPSDSNSKSDHPDAIYLRAENQAEAAVYQIVSLIKAGISPQDICVLSRNNRNLEDVALLASEKGVHVQLQSAAGFEETREILDLMAFNKFLNNPHDDENFVNVVRSPWFYISDEELLSLGEVKKLKKNSLWSCLQLEKKELAEPLSRYLEFFDSMGVLQTTKRFLTERSFVNFSAFYDPNGKREANIFKYVDALAQAEKKSGFSLGLFLDEQFQSLQVDSASGSAEAQPVIQPDCVSLMTIHASKGLQFKHVIILGFSDKLKLSHVSELTFDPSLQKFSLSVFNEETMKFEPSNWSQQLRKSFNLREIAESERLLYVAMTRAIKGLCLILDTSKRTDKNSWAARISWPQTGAQFGESFSAIGAEHSDTSENLARLKTAGSEVRKKFTEPSLSSDENRSVTDLLSPGQKNEATLSQQLINLHKAQYGSDLHRVFESLKYLDPKTVKEKLPVKDREAVDYLFSMKELDMQEVLSKGHNEWGFGLKAKSRFIQGQIDLWSELDNEIHVIDYKTGSSQYKEKALEQLAYYTCALFEMKQISPNKKIIHSVIYPLEKTVEIRKFSGRDEFEKQLPSKISEIFK